MMSRLSGNVLSCETTTSAPGSLLSMNSRA